MNKENEKKFQEFEKDLEEVKKSMQMVHDFTSFKYEDDPKKQMEKHLRLCEKYGLDPDVIHDLEFTKSKDSEEKIKKAFKDWKLKEL